MSYIATYTGRIFDYKNISKDSINIDDILLSLPRLNRFIGHSSRSYSVGEHSLYCYILAEELGFNNREQLLTFIHDFAEAYTGDCPAPLKGMLPDFSIIENKVELAIYEHLDIKPPTEDERALIKKIDKTMLAIEMRDLTLSNYGESIDDDIYTEIVDKRSIVGKNSILYSEKEIRELLQFVFNKLIKNYREEV